MFELSRWPYIQQSDISGDIKTDITNLLTLNGKQETAAHCICVAETSEKIATYFGLNTVVASTAALLHDISNVMQQSDMLEYAVNHNWMLDDSEYKHPFLLHQRLSTVFAAELFNINDERILSAIECHTTLKSNPSDYDMLLFLADKLSWDQNGTPPFYELVLSALEKSLHCASLSYINFNLENGMILCPHHWLIEAKKWLENYC